MAKFEYKYQMYKSLQANIPTIHAEAQNASNEIGIPAELRDKLGLTGANSSCPAPLRDDIKKAAEDISKEVVSLGILMDEIREIVKSFYGDEYDAAATNTCEAALWLSFDSLFCPPISGHGDNYRARYLAPYEKQLHYQGSYGRPYPPRYKDILADRGGTAGELGSFGKRLNNLDTILIPLDGAKYDVHGINYHPIPLLINVNAQASAKTVKKFADNHHDSVTGITSLAYDTPCYGYGEKDEDGTPLLQKLYAQIAKEYNIPYIMDNAWGLPFVGSDPRKTGADVIVYSMDKATGAATSGLVIGKEESMVTIRRAMGIHGNRYGTTSSYSKAAYSAFDPGKLALATLIQTLKVLRDNPQMLTKSVDDLEIIIKDEFANINPKLKAGIQIYKSYNSRTVEVNYEGTWKDGEMGLPIFSMEDVASGTNIIASGMRQMGIIPSGCNDGSICISPDMGTTDGKGNLLPDVTRYAAKALVRLLEIVAKHAGTI
ncbi:MAG: hypothetical protein HQM14_19745 [SAR324 cluster bacterium]|nr:hypothetical protein [SAR324 cluster bacterium]